MLFTVAAVGLSVLAATFAQWQPDPHAAAPPPPTPTPHCEPGGRASDGSPCCCLGCCPGQFWQTHGGAPPLPWAESAKSTRWAMNASTVDYFVGMATGLDSKKELYAGRVLGYYGSE